MGLVSVGVMPHGAMVLDISKKGLPSKAIQLHHACRETAQQIMRTRPDVILLISPHGFSLDTHLAIIQNEALSCSAEWLGDWKEYTVNLETDVSMAVELGKYLNSTKGVLSQNLVLPGMPSQKAQMAWGEAVPFHFLIANQMPDSKVKAVLISWPRSRSDLENYSAQAFKIGQAIYKFAQMQSKRVAVVFSCDMSHVYGNPANVDPMYCAQPEIGRDPKIAHAFDTVIQEWNELLIKGKVTEAKKKLDGLKPISLEAKACGWSGFQALQGMMELAQEDLMPRKGLFQNYSEDQECLINGWVGKLEGFAAPTYYGMMSSWISLKEKPIGAERKGSYSSMSISLAIIVVTVLIALLLVFLF